MTPEIDLSLSGAAISSFDPSRPAAAPHAPTAPVTGFMLSGTDGVLPLQECAEFPFSPVSPIAVAGPESMSRGLTGSDKVFPTYINGEPISFLFPDPQDGHSLGLVITGAFSGASSSPIFYEERTEGGTWVLAGESTSRLPRGAYKFILYDLVPGVSLLPEMPFSASSVVSSGMFHISPAEGIMVAPSPDQIPKSPWLWCWGSETVGDGSETDPPVVRLYNLVSGDTWPGISKIGPIMMRGPDPDAETVPMEAAVASARMSFIRTGSTTPSLRLGSGDGFDAPIVVSSAQDWELAIPAVPPSIWTPAPGNYCSDLEITDVNGVVRTTHRFILTVTPGAT